MLHDQTHLKALGERLGLEDLEYSPTRKRRRPRRLAGKCAWAIAAGLTCLGSFMPLQAADDIGVWGGGGGGGGSSMPYGGGGGAGKIIFENIEYSGNGGYGAASTAVGGEGSNKTAPNSDSWLGDGGAGEDYGIASSPGDGGETRLEIYGTQEVKDIFIYGGGAGGNGEGGGGGAGGYAGGTGQYGAVGGTADGEAGTSPGTSIAPGGNGGIGELFAETLRVEGDITVRSGDDAATVSSSGMPGAIGGSARFYVFHTLETTGTNQDFSFSTAGNDNAIDVYISSLRIGTDDGNVKINLDYTNTFSSVFIGDLTFQKNTTLTVVQMNGTETMTAMGSITAHSGSTLDLGTAATYDASDKTLQFHLPAGMANGDGILTVRNGDVDISRATIGIVTTGDTNLGAGDTITLIQAGSGSSILGTPGTTIVTTTGTGTNRLTLEIDSTSSSALTATVLRLANRGVSASLTDGATAARMGLLYGRSDAVVSYTWMLADQLPCSAKGWTTFATGGAFDGKLRTGTDLDVRGMTFSAGAAKNWNLGDSRFFAGIAAEAGRGNYTTTLVESGDRYRGDGHVSYYGGTFFGRWEMPQWVNLDASFSLGRVESDFRSSEYDGRKAYDEGALYVAGHIGVDRIFSFDQTSDIQLYSRMLYTRQSSDSFMTSENERMELDAFTSLRSVLGARYSYNVTKQIKVYTGAAWSHEFDGKATSLVNGQRPGQKPNLRGHSGTGELGMNWRQRDCGGWQADIAVRGHIGKRRGVSGDVIVGYSF